MLRKARVIRARERSNTLRNLASATFQTRVRWQVSAIYIYQSGVPLSWGDVVMWRLEPTWMVGYAFRRAELLAERGVTA